MIRFTCPGCGSKLNAKEEIAGQTRKCPKCGTAVTVPAVSEEAGIAMSETADAHAQPASELHLPTHHWPERLNRLNRYLILDKAHLVATWVNNGDGWMVKTNYGFVQASRNFELLPAQGDFKLVELDMELRPEGLRLRGIVVYQLARRWALTNLDKGDDRILKSIVGYSGLNRDQKSVVLKCLKEYYMRNVWEQAQGVLDYLTNTDYHTPGTLPVA